jgi:eukaryotic-like serine/threonine-protein kinase
LRDDDRAWHGLRDVQEVLDQAWQIRIARLFTTSELERAKTRDWDPRIGDAIEHADTHGLAEWLAAGPLLLRDWERARSSATETLARGAALVTAAIDLRRAGYLSPIPRNLLDEVHELYLDEREPARVPREPLGEAWAWATTRRAGSTRLLTPAADNRVCVFDYLTDTAQRRAGPLDRVLEPVVRSALASASASDANSIARTAYNQGRWQLAADAWRIACDLLAAEPRVGQHHPDTLTCRSNLALVLHDLGRLTEAKTEIRAVLAIRLRVLGPDHPDTVASRNNLALVLRKLGWPAEEEVQTPAEPAAEPTELAPDDPGPVADGSAVADEIEDGAEAALLVHER